MGHALRELLGGLPPAGPHPGGPGRRRGVRVGGHLRVGGGRALGARHPGLLLPAADHRRHPARLRRRPAQRPRAPRLRLHGPARALRRALLAHARVPRVPADPRPVQGRPRLPALAERPRLRRQRRDRHDQALYPDGRAEQGLRQGLVRHARRRPGHDSRPGSDGRSAALRHQRRHLLHSQDLPELRVLHERGGVLHRRRHRPGGVHVRVHAAGRLCRAPGAAAALQRRHDHLLVHAGRVLPPQRGGPRHGRYHVAAPGDRGRVHRHVLARPRATALVRRQRDLLPQH